MVNFTTQALTKQLSSEARAPPISEVCAMSEVDPGRIEKIFAKLRAGKSEAKDELIGAVYPELNRIAQRFMLKESPGHTLEPGAVVNEAWMRLRSGDTKRWGDRPYFFAAAATAMRRVLIEHARKKGADKRDHGMRITFDHDLAAEERQLIDLNLALEKLESENPRNAKVFILRFFGGFSQEEVASELGVSKSLISSEWQYARAWLRRELARSTGRT